MDLSILNSFDYKVGPSWIFNKDYVRVRVDSNSFGNKIEGLIDGSMVGTRDAPHGRISFIFTQYWAKILPNNRILSSPLQVRPLLPPTPVWEILICNWVFLFHWCGGSRISRKGKQVHFVQSPPPQKLYWNENGQEGHIMQALNPPIQSIKLSKATIFDRTELILWELYLA